MVVHISDKAYEALLTAVVQRFILLMGSPALRPARRVYGLKVDDEGIVTSYRGDGPVIMQSLVIEYITLLGPQAVVLSNRAIQPVLNHYPNVDLPSLLQ